MNESQMLMNEIVRTCAENGVSEEALNVALLSMLYTSMRAAMKEEHNLSNGDGELLLNVRRYK